MVNQVVISNLVSRKKVYLNLSTLKKKIIEVEKLEIITQKSDFWQDAKKAESQLKKLSSLKNWIKSYNIISENIDELSVLLELEASEEELSLQLKKTTKSIENLEFKNMLSAEEDGLSAIMTAKSRSWRNRRSRLGRYANANVSYVERK